MDGVRAPPAARPVVPSNTSPLRSPLHHPSPRLSLSHSLPNVRPSPCGEHCTCTRSSTRAHWLSPPPARRSYYKQPHVADFDKALELAVTLEEEDAIFAAQKVWASEEARRVKWFKCVLVPADRPPAPPPQTKGVEALVSGVYVAPLASRSSL